jgi:hypothetical protein
MIAIVIAASSESIEYLISSEMQIPCADAAGRFQRFAPTGVQFREIFFQNGDSGLEQKEIIDIRYRWGGSNGKKNNLGRCDR